MLFQFLTLLLFTYYGIMAVSVSPSVQMAAVISSAFYSVWFLFTGKPPAANVMQLLPFTHCYSDAWVRAQGHIRSILTIKAFLSILTLQGQYICRTLDQL